ncbi:MAG: CaiB/BaiF CoA-transferase family protein [Actinomycetes bacterium]
MDDVMTSSGSGRPSRPLLEGVVVLDLATVGPAARATRALSDFGATVMKVGPVPSAGAMQITPPYFAYSGHRGMGRLELDLKSDAGKEAFFALAATADVIVESFRPGVTDRLGIGYSDLAEVNPGLVYCSTSGYGQVGPMSQWAGHDVDYLAMGGFLATSEPRSDGGPPLPGATVADAAAGGLHAALSICAALVGRSSTGLGCHLDVAVADGVLWLMSLAIDEHLAMGTEPGPRHDLLTGLFACYGTYEAGDGGWLAVGAIEHKFFANLCRALDLERWIDHQMEAALQEEIRSDFASAFRTATRDEWTERLAGADTCVAPVLRVSELSQSANLVERSLIVEAHHPEHGTFLQLAPLLAGMLRTEEPVASPDLRVTVTAEMLRSAGVDDERIAEWAAEGVIA